MKNIFFVFVFSISTYSLIAQNAFSKGFKEGYEKGYCHNKGIGCVAPIAPVAPIPSAGESDNSFNDGYNRGFAIGLNQNKSNNNQSENNDDIYKGSTNGYPSSSNNGAIRQPIKYNKPTSSVNYELIAKILKEKQNAIDKERAYFNSLSYEERQALLKSRAYSKRKSNLYKKNISRFYKADKKAKKEAKNLEKELKRTENKYYSKSLLNISDIKNGWHKTIVNIWANGKSNYVNRLVYFENGVVTKYVGGTGFKAYIKEQKKENSEVISLVVGYEDSQNQKLFISFIENKPIKLKEEPLFPTIIKFYTTVSNGGKFFIYLNNKTYSDYFTLSQSFKPGTNISCEQDKGVVTFYVKPESNYEFYAHNDVNEWNGNIKTHNRYCIIKELSK